MKEQEAVALMAVEYWDQQIHDRQPNAHSRGGYEAWSAAIQSYIICTNVAHEMLSDFSPAIRGAIVGADKVDQGFNYVRTLATYAQVSLEYTRALPNVSTGGLLTVLILDHTRIALKKIIDITKGKEDDKDS